MPAFLSAIGIDLPCPCTGRFPSRSRSIYFGDVSEADHVIRNVLVALNNDAWGLGKGSIMILIAVFCVDCVV